MIPCAHRHAPQGEPPVLVGQSRNLQIFDCHGGESRVAVVGCNHAANVESALRQSRRRNQQTEKQNYNVSHFIQLKMV